MSRIVSLIAGCLLSLNLFSQSVGIGTSTPHSSSQLDIRSNNKGFLIPRMTTSGVSSISNPAKGLMVYDSTKNQLMVNMGSTSSPNWQTVVFKSGWSLKGNSGTSVSADFIGTTDSVGLFFKANNQMAGRVDVTYFGNTYFGYQSGRVDTGIYNVGLGKEVLYSNKSGSFNTAMGAEALYSNTGGSNNVAVGNGALRSNLTGHWNTAVGSGSLSVNASGQSNCAFGVSSLALNVSGSSNTAVGYYALLRNTSNNNTATGMSSLQNNVSGYDNTATGNEALYNNSTGTLNTATGSETLFRNTTGSHNTAMGVAAMSDNQTGGYNVAMGYQAMFGNKNSFNTGIGAFALTNTINSQYNTAIGYLAGNTYNNGYNNVFVGANVDVNADGLFNVIAIGQATVAPGSSTARFGNSATVSYGGWAGWTNVSDGRFKKNIKENVPGLDFINKLRPVTYQLAATELDAFLHKNDPSKTDPSATQWHAKALNEKEKIIYSGFVAQEVEAAARRSGFDFSGVDAPRNADDTYGLRYAEFVVPLVKAVQELSQQNDELKKQNEELVKRMEKLESFIANKK